MTFYCGYLYRLLVLLLIITLPLTAFAHTVDEDTKQFLLNTSGVQLVPFLYIGADHMVTGYDHLLFLVGVIFFLHKTKDILLYVSLFTIGHSLTLLTGVLNNIEVNAYLIDAIIGLSVVYKGFDNLGGFQRCFGVNPNTKLAVLIFGLFHGFGLATKLQEFQLKQDGLVENLLAFNIGVEIGQFIALGFVLLLINYWRAHKSFSRFSTATNTLLMSSGIMLMGLQLTGYFVNQ